MLEGCRSILECEAVLAAYIRQSFECGRPVLLLCKVPLTEKDVEDLSLWVAECLEMYPGHGVEFLAERTPACLAHFLVWQGIAGYKYGNYWSAVREVTGIEDRHWETVWGSAFLAFLEAHQMLSLPEPRSHRYVAPILLHGGVPDHCLAEYFRDVIWSRFVNKGVTLPEDIGRELERLRAEVREFEFQTEEIQEDINRLIVQQNRLSRLKRLFGEYEKTWEHLDDIERRTADIERLRQIAEQIEELERQRENLLAEQALLDTAQQASEVRTELEEMSCMYRWLRDWKARLTEEMEWLSQDLAGTDWERELYARLLVLTTEAGERSAFWLRLIIRAFEAVRELPGWDADRTAAVESARRLLGELGEYGVCLNDFTGSLARLHFGLEDCPLDDTPALLSSVPGPATSLRAAGELLDLAGEVVHRWTDALAGIQERRGPETGTAIDRELDEMEAALERLKKECQELGDLLPGLEGWSDSLSNERLADVAGKWQRAETDIRKQLAELDAEGRELLGRALDRSTVDMERQLVQQELEELQRRLKELRSRMPAASPVWLVDRPILRFLVYGGETADDFVQHTVTLLDISCNEGEPRRPPGWPDTYRYQRIWEEFRRWWDKAGRGLCMVKVRLSRPRLICWREPEAWYVGVEVPEDLLDQEDLAVVHQGRELKESPRREGCWRLNGLDGDAEICAEHGVLSILPLEKLWQRDTPVLVFRGWDGHRTPLPALGKVSSGKVTVVVPETWQRDTDRCGPPPVAPESVALPGYRVHFFDLTRGTGTIAFSLLDGSQFTVETGMGRFRLMGRMLSFDAHHELGRIFVSDPPRIRPIHDGIWNEVGVVTRFARRLRCREAVKLKDVDEPTTGELSTAVDGRPYEDGCYWMVMHDKNVYEMERIPFRYISCLKDIRCVSDNIPLFPDVNGHTETAVEFVFDPSNPLELRDSLIDEGIRTDHHPGCLRIVFPPYAHLDYAELMIEAAYGATVPIAVVFERVWWAVGEEGDDGLMVAWTDKIVTLEKDWFRPTSGKMLWIRWPRSNAAGAPSQAWIGFDQEKRFCLTVKSEKQAYTAQIPLRTFCDIWEEEFYEDQSLKIWLVTNDQEMAAGTIGVFEIPLDPERKRSCATCGYARVFGSPLRVHVRCQKGKWHWMPKEDFDRNRAGYVCTRWTGEL